MYRKWTVEEIKEEIDKIAFKLEYPCDLKVEISSRATKRLGAFFYRKEKNKIMPLKFVFAKVLIDGYYLESIVKEVIIHEYLHYFCDTKTGISNGHNKIFKEMCLKCGINPKATLKDDRIGINDNKSNLKLYKIYCINCGKIVCVHKRKDAAERKVNGYISKCCKARLNYKTDDY